MGAGTLLVLFYLKHVSTEKALRLVELSDFDNFLYKKEEIVLARSDQSLIFKILIIEVKIIFIKNNFNI